MKSQSWLIVFLLWSCTSSAQTFELNGILPTALVDEAENQIQIETKMLRGGKIWAMDWSPNGKYLAIGNKTGHVRIYETNHFQLVDVLTGFNTTINGISWSPDNQKIAASGFDPRIIIWNLKDHTSKIIEEHEAQVRGVQWSPNGNFLASTSHDGRIIVWNQDAQAIKTFRGSHGGCVDIDWLDENILAAACWDNTVRIYNMIDTSSIVSDNGARSKKAVLSVDWHPSGQFFATGDYGNPTEPDNNVRYWSPQGKLISEQKDHQLEIRSIAWSPSGDLLATGGETVRTWDQKGALVNTFSSSRSPVWSVDWDDKGERIASGHNDGNVIIWDRDGNELTRIKGHSTEISTWSYHADSSVVLIGLDNGEFRLINLNDMTSISKKINIRGISGIAWHPKGKSFALGSHDGKGSIWKFKKGKIKLTRMLAGHSSNIFGLAWRPDGKRLASVGNESRILIWNAKGKLLDEIQTEKEYIKNVVWKDNQAQPHGQESADRVSLLPVKVGQKEHTFVPLSNNRFALFNISGQLIHGPEKEFTYLKMNIRQKVELVPFVQETARKKYIFFLHNRFLENNNIDAEHTTHGRVEYNEILTAFRNENFNVISEQRNGNVNAREYALSVVTQINDLISKGVAPENITVIGTSKGGYIAQYISTFMRNPKMNFIFIGAFQKSDVTEIPEIQYCGNILNIYDTSDRYGDSALSRKESSQQPITRFREVELNLNMGHGFLFKALPEWIQPCIDWANQKY